MIWVTRKEYAAVTSGTCKILYENMTGICNPFAAQIGYI